MSNLLNREWTVLSSGIGDGATKTAQETWNNLTTEVYRFADAPLSTTGNYLKNHAGDFATGAAIALLTPKGVAAKVLAVWSLRGVGIATLDAVVKAGDSSCNAEQVAAEFSRNLAHEGTNFISSMPMALAGGIAGRSLANGFLGRGNVLPDLATGKVTLADVRRNAGTVADSLSPKRTKVLITDLDDTLFPLQEYLIPMLEKNSAMLGNRMGMPAIDAIRALGPERIHPWILEESVLAKQWKGTPAEFTRDVVKPFWQNDAEGLGQCKPYPQVAETLQALRDRGIKIVVQTNAPVPWAIKRLTQIGLDGHIDSLYAIEAPKPSLSRLVTPEALNHGQLLLEDALAIPHKIPEIRVLPPEFRKPNVAGLGRVLDDMGVKPREALAIGDTLASDGAAPRYHGVPFVWAEWGHRIDPRLRSFMDSIQVKHDGVAGSTAARPSSATTPRPIGVAHSYAEILDYVDRKRDLGLFWNQIKPDIGFRSTLLPLTAYNAVPEFMTVSYWRDKAPEHKKAN